MLEVALELIDDPVLEHLVLFFNFLSDHLSQGCRVVAFGPCSDGARVALQEWVRWRRYIMFFCSFILMANAIMGVTHCAWLVGVSLAVCSRRAVYAVAGVAEERHVKRVFALTVGVTACALSCSCLLCVPLGGG